MKCSICKKSYGFKLEDIALLILFNIVILSIFLKPSESWNIPERIFLYCVPIILFLFARFALWLRSTCTDNACKVAYNIVCKKEQEEQERKFKLEVERKVNEATR